MSIRAHTVRVGGAALVLMGLALALLVARAPAGEVPPPPRNVQPSVPPLHTPPPEQPSRAQLPTISINDVTVREPKRMREAFFTMTLSEPSPALVHVYYETVAGSATPGRDYRSTSGTVAFQPGETSKTLAVWILGDRKREPAETFLVQLSNPQGAELVDAVGEARIVARKDLCVCDKLDVKLGYEGYYSTSNGPTAGWTMFVLAIHHELTCTKGDPSDCKGRYQVLYSEGPPNSGTHIPAEDKLDVVCRSPHCDKVTGKHTFRLRIKNEAIQGNVVTIKIKVRYWCLTGKDTAPRTKTLSLVLDNGQFDANASDLNGDGVAGD